MSDYKTQTNPEIEAVLDELADLVCQSLQGDASSLPQRHQGLLKSLVMSGYSWKSSESLMMNIENRVKDRCGEAASHRGGALSSITQELSESFTKLARWESRTPSDETPAKPANISSATDA